MRDWYGVYPGTHETLNDRIPVNKVSMSFRFFANGARVPAARLSWMTSSVDAAPSRTMTGSFHNSQNLCDVVSISCVLRAATNEVELYAVQNGLTVFEAYGFGSRV